MQNQPENEIDIVRRAQSGDRSAFDQLVRRNQDMAVAYAASILGDFDTARDAAQDAFVEMYLQLRSLRSPEAFRTWLKRIVFKHCNRRTRGKRITPVPLDAADAIASPLGDPVAAAERHESRQEIHALIDSLPATERTVILLFYIGSHSYEEVAGFLGIATKTVKSRLYSGRQRLQERMLQTVENTLNDYRPSRAEDFAANVAAMITAIDNGDANTVQTLVAARPELADAKTPRPFWSGDVRALHAAVLQGDVAIVRTLIAAGADVDAMSDQYSWRPIHLALDKPEILALLIGAGAQQDIFTTSAGNDASLVAEMLRADPQLANATGPDGATPLHFAATVGIAQLLLDHHAEIDRVDASHGCTPLQWSIERPEPVAQFLLGRGASIDFWSACALGLENELRSFLDANADRVHELSDPRNVLRLGFAAYPLHFAARYGSVESCRILCGAGASVTARSSDGSLAIHDAAFRGHWPVIAFLIECGCPINDRDTTYGATPLGTAEFAGHTEVVARLREVGGE